MVFKDNGFHVHTLSDPKILSKFERWALGGHSLSSRTPRARQKNLIFLRCITKLDQIFVNFFNE